MGGPLVPVEKRTFSFLFNSIRSSFFLIPSLLWVVDKGSFRPGTWMGVGYGRPVRDSQETFRDLHGCWGTRSGSHP